VAAALTLLLTALAALAVGIVAVNREKERTEQARQRTRAALDEISSQVIEDWLAQKKQLEPAQRTFLEKALGYYEEFARESGHTEEVRQGVAGAHLRVGRIREKLGQHAEAEAAFRRAAELYARLAAEFPATPQYREGLAMSHNSLLLSDTGRAKEAEAAYTDARDLQKALAADFPQVPDYHNDLAGSLVNRARLANGRRDFGAARRELAEALPHHHAALQASPRNPTYRRFYRNHLGTLIASCAGLQDQASAVRAAQTLRDLGWDPAGNAYDAACALALCIPLVEKDPHADAGRRHQQARFYGDQALAMLRTAVAKGYKDAANLKKDTDLDPLRGRDDFRTLLAEVEAAARPKEGARP
jgi:hypothetical protein